MTPSPPTFSPFRQPNERDPLLGPIRGSYNGGGREERGRPAYKSFQQTDSWKYPQKTRNFRSHEFSYPHIKEYERNQTIFEPSFLKVNFIFPHLDFFLKTENPSRHFFSLRIRRQNKHAFSSRLLFLSFLSTLAVGMKKALQEGEETWEEDGDGILTRKKESHPFPFSSLIACLSVSLSGVMPNTQDACRITHISLYSSRRSSNS